MIKAFILVALAVLSWSWAIGGTIATNIPRRVARRHLTPEEREKRRKEREKRRAQQLHDEENHKRLKGILERQKRIDEKIKRDNQQ